MNQFCIEAKKYLEDIGFTVTNVYDDFFDFKGDTHNDLGELVESEGSMSFSPDGVIDYSVAYTIDGKELDGMIGSTRDEVKPAVYDIIRPIFSKLN